MVKKLFLCALACIAFTTATADEGMWLPSLIKERMGESKDFGSITRGKVANFYITKPLPSLAFLPYAHQTPVIEQIVLKGKVVSLMIG